MFLICLPFRNIPGVYKHFQWLKNILKTVLQNLLSSSLEKYLPGTLCMEPTCIKHTFQSFLGMFQSSFYNQVTKSFVVLS